MIYRIVTACVAGLLATFASAADFNLPKYEKYQLANGLTVYMMQQDEVPLVDVVAVVKSGAINDTQSGLAKLTSESLMLGTQSYPKAQYEQKLDFIGSRVSVEAQSEYTKLFASLAAKDVDTVLPMVFETLAKPTFNQEEFNKLKNRHLATLARQKESPRQMVGKFFNSKVYANHPYANDVDGNEQSVQGIKHADIVTFHKTWYQPNNTAIAVVGDFDIDKMKSKLNALFSSWKGAAKSQNTLHTPSPIKGTNVLLVNKDDATESTFMVGGKGIEFGNEDYVAISIINTVLGGRFTSWLNDELRVNSGLTYGARSRFARRSVGGSFYISSFTKTQTTVEALDLAIKTYQRLWEKGLDQETLDSAKAYVKGQFPPGFETSEQLANLMANMFVYGFDESYINTFSDQVNKLTVESSKQLINKYFPKDDLQFVVVGKASEIKEKLEKYGPVTIAEIATPL